MNIDATVTIEHLPVKVTGTYVPAERGARDSLGGIRGAGPPLEPDVPAHIEDMAVVAYIGTEFIDVVDLLDPDTLAELEGELIAAREDRDAAMAEDYHNRRTSA